jgi:hypothetical protein
MNRKQAINNFAIPLSAVLSKHFKQCYWTKVGKHWSNIQNPLEFGENLIEVNMEYAGRYPSESYNGFRILKVDFTVRSIDTAYVTAAFNIPMLKCAIIRAFNIDESGIVNMWVNFETNTVEIIVKKDNYHFHINLTHKN